MKNEYYFQINVSAEQVEYVNRIVDYSLLHHPVANIWDGQAEKQAKTRDYRFTGSLGEVVFADLYGLRRKARAYGAIDGQDYGKDFRVRFGQKPQNVDTKAMQRRGGTFQTHYVLNIPASQLTRPDSQTDYYYCISFHQQAGLWVASVLGYVSRAEILQGEAGILYVAGTERTRADGTRFPFNEDTYEVMFGNINTPYISAQAQNTEGFCVKYLQHKPTQSLKPF